MDQDQEAINTLKQLGVTEARAREALSKSNGDLQRAANFIFENQSTDPEETPDLAPLGTDSQTNNNWEDGDNKMLGYLDPNANNPSSFENDDLKKALEASMDDIEKKDIQMAMDMSKNPYPDLKDGYNSQAVVLYNGNKDNNDSQYQNLSDQNWQNGCWDDQPAKRVKLDTTPLGLRPVIDFYYATSFFQALFHIPVFRLSLLAYHPTKDNWGNVEGYWKGQKHYNSTDDYNRKSYNNINRSATLKFIHEFQKLFGFLSLSQRTYGDSSFLMDALDFDEKATWNEVEVMINFTSKLINKLLEGSNYRITENKNIPAELQRYILDFEKLFKSNAENLTTMKYETNYYQSDRHRTVTKIILDVYPNFQTIYDALDHKIHESNGNSSKPFFFTQLANILIMNLRHKDNYNNNYSTFQILKEIYMDRYMYENSTIIEKNWSKIEIMKNNLEKIKQSIDKIIKFQGKYNGPDLLRGSIEHFKRKCRKAEEKDSYDDDAQQTTTWLERVLDKVEQKLSVLLEKKDELEQKIKQMFDTPDMKEIHYRLKAVLVHNGQTGQGNHWAYIWVSRCSRPDILCTSTMDNGSWMKFQDTVVEDALEEVVLNEPGGIYPNNSVYTLFYVNANVDYNFPNIVDIIPDSLKAFVEKDNQILEEEIANQYRQVDSELPDSNAMDSTWESDSTACGGSPDSEKTIQLNINTIFQQANNIKIYDAKILKRIEFFFFKIGQGEAIKSLLTEYAKSTAGWSWDDPILLDEKYRKDQRYIEVVKAFEEFKEITQYIVEGWEQMVEKNDFISAIAYFHRAITLENAWISNITFSSKFMVNVEDLRRASFITQYAKICLKKINDTALEKARKNELVEAIEKATFVHRTFLVFVEPKNCRSDVLYFEFCQQWLNLSEHIPEPTNEAYRNSIAKLIDDYAVAIDSYDGEYTREILFDKIDTIPTDSDDTLYERYYKLTWKCKDVFEKYNVPEL